MLLGYNEFHSGLHHEIVLERIKQYAENFRGFYLIVGANAACWITNELRLPTAKFELDCDIPF